MPLCGQVAEWLKAADCKSARASVRWFESSPVHQPLIELSGTPKGKPQRKGFSQSTRPPISPIGCGMTGRISPALHVHNNDERDRSQPVCAFPHHYQIIAPVDADVTLQALVRLQRRFQGEGARRLSGGWVGVAAMRWVGMGRHRSSGGRPVERNSRKNCTCTASIIHTCIASQVRKAQCLMRTRGNKALMGNMKTI